MKKRFLLTIGAILCIACVSRISSVHAQVNTEHIQQFNTDVVVNNDASIDVAETIQYVFPAGEERHGIYRTIPLKNIEVSNISVTDEDAQPYHFTASRSGESETIKIGDANVTVTGTRTYIIHYHVKGALTHSKTIDELYWNATGNEWEYPMLNTRQTVTLPSVVAHDMLQVSCYQGAQGSKESCDQFVTVADMNTHTVISFASSVMLNPHEGVTIAIGIPKGVVTEPTAWQRFINALKNSIAVILSMIILVLSVIFSLRRYYKTGREPQGSGIIVAQYDAPDNIHPSEMAALLNKSSSSKDISAELINLAVKGYIKIERKEKGNFFFKNSDYELTLLKEIGNADSIDHTLLEGLFPEGKAGDTMLLSDAKGSFYRVVRSVKKTIMDNVMSRGYFVRNPVTARERAMGILMLGIFFSIFAGAFAASISGQWYVIPILLLATIVIAVFMRISTPRTKKGVATKEYSLGLREYLQIAEKDRINFHNAPEKNPELFEELLPYAMVLGVEKAWAKEFEGIYVTPPSWYVDPQMRGFNSLVLINSFSNFTTATASSFSAPSSSASSGGGFSGGGVGGGGGGSW